MPSTQEVKSLEKSYLLLRTLCHPSVSLKQRIKRDSNFNPGYNQQGYGGYPGSTAGDMRASGISRPGVPYAGNQSGYSNGLMSDVTSTAGYTLSGPSGIDPQQEQNMHVASQELSQGR